MSFGKDPFSHINQPSPVFSIVRGSSEEITSVGWNSVLQLDLFLVCYIFSSSHVTQCLSVTSRCGEAGGCLRCHVGSRRSLVFLGFQCSLGCDDVRVVLRSEKESVVMCRAKLLQASGHAVDERIFHLCRDQDEIVQVWILQWCLYVSERSSHWGRKGDWNREMIKW